MKFCGALFENEKKMETSMHRMLKLRVRTHEGSSVVKLKALVRNGNERS